MSVACYLIDIVTVLANIAVAYHVFFSIMFHKNGADRRIEYCIGLSVAVLMVCLLIYDLPESLNAQVFGICILGYSIYACEGRLLLKILSAMMAISFMLMGRVFAAGAAELLIGQCSFLPDTPVMHSICVIIPYYFYLLGTALILQIFPVRQAHNPQNSQGLLVLGLLLLTAVFIYIITRYMAHLGDVSAWALMLTPLFFIAQLLFTVFFYVTLLRTQEEARARAVLNSQLSYYNSQQESFRRSHQALRGVRHDLQNHIIVIRGLIDRKQWPAIEKYMLTLKTELETSEVIHTGNLIADIVLSNKCTYARSRRINVTVEACLPQDLQIEAADLSVLLGNALDNATEACEKILCGERYIHIKISMKKAYLYLSLENSIHTPPHVVRGEFRSKKDDGDIHGIGIKNMRSIAQKYNGHLSLDFDEEHFRLDCILQDKKPEAY